MDLNTFGLLFLGSIVGYGTYQYWKSGIAAVPKTLKTPWGQQVGRTRPIQSKNGDASMATEARRRRAIQGASCEELYKLKESRTTTGSATGAIETYFLTSVCPARPKKSVVPDVLPELPPSIPDVTYTFTADGLDTSVWSSSPTALVDVVSSSKDAFEEDVDAPVPGNYMARLKASSPVNPTVLVLPFFAPGRSEVTFVIQFLHFDGGFGFSDIATVLDVVQTPSEITTLLYSSVGVGNYAKTGWLTITRVIPNGGQHNLTFTVKNTDDELAPSELLVYSVRIVRHVV
jgi:hypothetical protein